MSGRRATWLVARREIVEAFRRRAYWALAALILVLSSAAMIVPELVDDNGRAAYDVAVVDPDPTFAATLEGLAEQLDVEVTVTELPDLDAAEAAVDRGDVDLGVRAGDDPHLVVLADGDLALVGIVQQAMQNDARAARLADAGLDETQIAEVLSLPEPGVTEVGTDEADRRAAASAIGLVLYVLLLMLMVQVSNGVAIEKANRISEVLLPIVRPGSLLFGKVLGVSVIGLVALACAAAPVLVKLAVGGDLPDGVGPAVAAGSAWFVIGLGSYLVAAGALGAMVERQEEVGSAIMPLSILIIGTFFVGQGAADQPLGAVLAVTPFTSPLVMPSRIAMGEATVPEIVASLVLGVLAIAVVLRIGAVVYRRAIVRTGARLHLTDVMRAR